MAETCLLQEPQGRGIKYKCSDVCLIRWIREAFDVGQERYLSFQSKLTTKKHSKEASKQANNPLPLSNGNECYVLQERGNGWVWYLSWDGIDSWMSCCKFSVRTEWSIYYIDPQYLANRIISLNDTRRNLPVEVYLISLPLPTCLSRVKVLLHTNPV